MENIDDTQQNNGQDKLDNLTNMIYNVAQNVNLLSKQMEAMLTIQTTNVNDIFTIKQKLQTLQANSMSSTSSITARINDTALIVDRMDDMLQDVQNTMQQIPNEFTQLQSQIANIKIYQMVDNNNF